MTKANITCETLDRELGRWYDICRWLVLGRSKDFGYMNVGDIWADMYYMIENLWNRRHYGIHPVSEDEAFDELVRFAKIMKKYDKKLGNQGSVINRAKKLIKTRGEA